MAANASGPMYLDPPPRAAYIRVPHAPVSRADEELHRRRILGTDQKDPPLETVRVRVGGTTPPLSAGMSRHLIYSFASLHLSACLIICTEIVPAHALIDQTPMSKKLDPR